MWSIGLMSLLLLGMCTTLPATSAKKHHHHHRSKKALKAEVDKDTNLENSLETDLKELRSEVKGMSDIVQVNLTRVTGEINRRIASIHDEMKLMESAVKNIHGVEGQNDEWVEVVGDSGIIDLYKPFRKERYWFLAQQHCELLGGHLATPITSVDSESLLQAIETNKAFAKIKPVTHIWVGAHRVAEGDTWQWLDGEQLPVPSERWHTGEPNNFGGTENCVVYWTRFGKGKRKFEDSRCDLEAAYVCQKKHP